MYIKYIYIHRYLFVRLLDNIALHKPAMQSSNYGHLHKADRAVDGNADPYYHSNHCSCTGESYEPWWAVDLQRRYTVLSVSLTNRLTVGMCLEQNSETVLNRYVNICSHFKWNMDLAFCVSFLTDGLNHPKLSRLSVNTAFTH